MNNNLNTNELIEKLSEMLNRENENIAALSGEQKTFSEGYAEGIADVIFLLEQSKEEQIPEVVDLHLEEYKVTKVIDDDAWMDEVPEEEWKELAKKYGVTY